MIKIEHNDFETEQEFIEFVKHYNWIPEKDKKEFIKHEKAHYDEAISFGHSAKYGYDGIRIFNKLFVYSLHVNVESNPLTLSFFSEKTVEKQDYEIGNAPKNPSITDRHKNLSHFLKTKLNL